MLVVLRHGQSTWNELNLFTGWHDVPLSAKGEAEADAAGRTLREAGLRFDAVYTSLLSRAMDTNRRALAQLGQPDAPVTTDWRLNERHYGALQGLDKKETTRLHGAEQTKLWRRSYDVPPPPVDRASPEHPANDARYAHIDAKLLPATECLKDVVVRVVPFWREVLGGVVSWNDTTYKLSAYACFADMPINYTNGITGRFPMVSTNACQCNWTSCYYELI